MIEPVKKTIEVGCDAASAFDIFVNYSSSWWPLDRHSTSAGEGKIAKAVVVEGSLGGAGDARYV